MTEHGSFGRRSNRFGPLKGTSAHANLSDGALVTRDEVLSAHSCLKEADEVLMALRTSEGYIPRNALNPKALGGMVTNVAIFEMLHDADGTFNDARIRLLGSELERFYGPVTGTLVSEYPNKVIAHRLWDRARQCALEVEPCGTLVKIHSDEFGLIMNLGGIYYPMSTNDKFVDQAIVLGVFSSVGPDDDLTNSDIIG